MSWTTSTSGGAGAAAGAAAAGAVAACSTSSATMRPSGPVPTTDARSTPRSRAMRRASGLAFTRAPVPASPGGRRRWAPPPGWRALVSAAAAASVRGGARDSRATPTAAAPAVVGAESPAGDSATGTSSPSAPMSAIVVPTSTSPSGTTILSSTPSASASTSCVTLSVSSSYRRLALGDRIAFGLQPADDRAGLHALPEPRQLHLGRHV